MNWLAWILVVICVWFIAGIATVAIVNAWRDFVRREPESAFAAAAVAFVALAMVGVFLEAVAS